MSTTGADAPIAGQWIMRDGWTVNATIVTENVGGHLLPKEQIAEITGHGYRIHTDLTFGDYQFSGVATAAR